MGKWHAVIDRLTPGKESYREPRVVAEKIGGLADSVRETVLGVLETEVSLPEKIAVMRPLMIAFTVDPWRCRGCFRKTVSWVAWS